MLTCGKYLQGNANIEQGVYNISNEIAAHSLVISKIPSIICLAG